MNITITTDVTVEPVTLEEVRERVKYDDGQTGQVDMLKSMIKSARNLCEGYTDRAFAEKTLTVIFHRELDYDDEEMTVIPPIAPLNSITSLKSMDREGTETSLTSGTDYFVIGTDRKEIYIPSIVGTYSGGSSVDIKYWKAVMLVGYASGSLPEIYKEAILKTVAEWYKNKGNYIPKLDDQVKMMLDTQGDKGWL